MYVAAADIVSSREEKVEDFVVWIAVQIVF